MYNSSATKLSIVKKYIIEVKENYSKQLVITYKAETKTLENFKPFRIQRNDVVYSRKA